MAAQEPTLLERVEEVQPSSFLTDYPVYSVYSVWNPTAFSQARHTFV
jgi:hypothetical protein